MWKALRPWLVQLALVKFNWSYVLRVIEMVTCFHIIANTWRHWT